MKAENLTKYTCDFCGKSEYVKKDDPRPMQEYRLPMKYYTETGREQGMTNQAVDMCRECAEELVRNLSKHYKLCSIAYFGVQAERINTEEKE
jgi:hypothetical protein